MSELRETLLLGAATPLILAVPKKITRQKKTRKKNIREMKTTPKKKKIAKQDPKMKNAGRMRHWASGDWFSLPDPKINIGSKPIHPHGFTEMTIHVRGANSNELDKAFYELVQKPIAQRTYLTHAELIERFGASAHDLDAVEEYASKHRICVQKRDPGSQTLVLWGARSDFQQAFKVKWVHNRPGNRGYPYGRTGPMWVPELLKSIITFIGDMSDPPQKLTRVRPHAAGKAGKAQVVPTKVPKDLKDAMWTGKLLAEHYQFPKEANGKLLDGTGQTVALIELGQGYDPKDIEKYFSALNLRTPNVIAASFEGGKNRWQSMGGEVITDIDVVGAIVPRARQVVYFGEEMTAEELYKVVTMAVMDSERKPTVISISWGWPEDQVPWQVSWGMRRLFKKAALLGITMCVATSDYGSLDIDRESSAAKKNKGRLHVDFPACLEASLACGGTWFTSEGEVTWNEGNGRATGGGISEIIPMPAYQNNAGVPHRENGKTGRGVPDVLGIAKHHTFIQKGEVMHASGTSFVAPMWAGLIARLNQALGKPVGFINPILYDNPKAFQVIAKGHNDVRPFPKQEKDPPYKYKAEPKWDPATGLGIPRGEALLQAVQTWNPGSDVKAPKADK